MKKRKAAFIGAGAIAREHMFAMQFIDAIDVVAVCDLSAARAESAAERFRVPHWFTSHAEMLKSVEADFIHITTPPQSHFSLSRDCLEAGRNVLCEKPITSNVEEFTVLKKIAIQNSLALYENHNYRTHSSILRIKQLQEKGDLGEIVEVQVEVRIDMHAKGSVFNDPNVPHYSASMKGGVAGDFLTHMTYLAQMFIGEDAKSVMTWNTLNPSSKLGQDEFRALLKGDKATGYLSFSGNTQPAGFWVRVIGTKAHAEVNLFEPPRMAVRRLRGAGGPLSTFKDGLVEAKDVFGSSFGGLYRKFSGKARYDGLQQFIEKCYASLDTPGEAPVTLSQIETCSRLVSGFCSDGLSI